MSKEGTKMLVKFMEMSLKHSGMSVPAPQPLLNKRAKETLSSDGLDAWTDIQIALNKVGDDDGKKLARLLIHKYYDVLSIMNDARQELMEETKETLDYVHEHPEYQQKPASDSIMEDFMGMFDED